MLNMLARIFPLRISNWIRETQSISNLVAWNIFDLCKKCEKIAGYPGKEGYLNLT